MDPRTEHMLAERRAGQASAPPPATPGTRSRSQGAPGLRTNKWLVSAILAVIGVAALAGRYVLVTRPAQDRARALAVTREISEQQVIQTVAHTETLDTCLADAQSEFAKTWDASCQSMRRKANCTLPSDTASRHDVSLRYAREACFKTYSAR